MNKLIFIPAIAAVLFSASMALIYYSPNEAEASLDTFAACLAQKNITMYGADWCPHCQNEKKAFGDSFRLVPYVECPENTKLCIDLKIAGYPTWIFPDGKRLQGEQGLVALSRESECPLPQSN
ncbi:MAG: hypothetical protein AAB378_00215 [Patescibacteria group bacterium]